MESRFSAMTLAIDSELPVRKFEMRVSFHDDTSTEVTIEMVGEAAVIVYIGQIE